jgi:hypothetical protein
MQSMWKGLLDLKWPAKRLNIQLFFFFRLKEIGVWFCFLIYSFCSLGVLWVRRVSGNEMKWQIDRRKSKLDEEIPEEKGVERTYALIGSVGTQTCGANSFEHRR